ncbi:MAG: hypothetical protein LC777_13695 [Actinobacteria bacterium]|nr:hypothetical protein [Actinomycetota bacterium]
MAALPTAAHGSLVAPPGPWPTTVVGATSPLTVTPFVFNGAHATANASLRVWLPHRRAHRVAITRQVGRRIVVRGRLRNRDTHRSISTAALQLAAQDAAGGDWQLIGMVLTNRRGRFRAVLPPGPSRRIAVLYWPDVNAPGPVFSRRLLVRASARVYLKTVMLKRHRIVFRGRVSGAPIPAGGLVVAAQVRNGRAWATVRLVRTLPSGRFVARYRFKYGDRRYQVRALAPAQPAWPLYSGPSQPRRVRSR